MNLVSADPTAPPPAQPAQWSVGCDRHPSERFTGFCPSCLCERLTFLDNSSSNTSSSSRRPSSASAAAAAAIRSLFPSNSKGNYHSHLPPLPKAPKPSTFYSQLRRANSFSASKNESFGLAYEPQRKSCDVRARNTLSSLFTLDKENRCGTTAAQSHHICQNARNVERFRDSGIAAGGVVEFDDDYGGGGAEIAPVAETPLNNLTNSLQQASTLKPLKEHTDLSNILEKRSPGGGIWAAASVFSKKWQKWRQKQRQKTKKQTKLPLEKPIYRQHRETQSEVADYGYGRRSCDTDPRISLDAGRINVDDPRFSFEEPRASWDGYLTGRSVNRMMPMFSVLENAPLRPRPDMLIPVEESAIGFQNEAERAPGGSAQTREYYSDSSCRRRKSLDRSSSMRQAAAVVAETVERKPVLSNTKVSPTSADYFHGANVMFREKMSRDLRSNSLRDPCSQTLELARDSSRCISRSREEKDPEKSRGWRWRLWGFIHRRTSVNKDEEKLSRATALERSYSASWQDGTLNRSTSLRRRNGIHSGSAWKPVAAAAMSSHGCKRRQECTPGKNIRSGRRLPENGVMRFYFTPTTSRGNQTENANTNSQPIARSVVRLY